jgi:hypothetical protein
MTTNPVHLIKPQKITVIMPSKHETIKLKEKDYLELYQKFIKENGHLLAKCPEPSKTKL